MKYAYLNFSIDHLFPAPPNLKGKTLYEAAQELEYLDNVVQESLRMYSPGAMYVNVLRDLCLPLLSHKSSTHPLPWINSRCFL